MYRAKQKYKQKQIDMMLSKPQYIVFHKYLWLNSQLFVAKSGDCKCRLAHVHFYPT